MIRSLNNTMRYGEIEDIGQIEDYLRRDPCLHLYGLGDLDPKLWPRTNWYAAWFGDDLAAVLTVFDGYGTPVLLALGGQNQEALSGLVENVALQLPDYGEVHYTPQARRALRGLYTLLPDQAEPDHYKMILEPSGREYVSAGVRIDRLGREDAYELEQLYDRAFYGEPGESSFDRSMLDDQPFYGIRRGTRIVCAAGTHFVSAELGVAAVAGVATDPEFRGQGLATAVTAELCSHLRSRVGLIGLNVRKGNNPAIASYARLGFKVCAEYSEARIERRHLRQIGPPGVDVGADT